MEAQFPKTDLISIIKETFRFDEFGDQRNRYNRSSVLTLDEFLSNGKVLRSLRDTAPKTLNRARGELDTYGFYIVLDTIIVTDYVKKHFSNLRARHKKLNDKEEWNRDIDCLLDQLEYREDCTDGTVVRLNALQLSKEYQKEAEFVADFLLETAKQVVYPFYGENTDAPFRDWYSLDYKTLDFKGMIKYPSLRGAYAVDILIKIGLEPEKVAQKLWRTGIKNKCIIAESYVKECSIDNVVLGKYVNVMSPETRQYLELEHPEVLRHFYEFLPQELSSEMFVNAFKGDIKNSGQFGMSLKNSLTAIQKFVDSLRNFYEHKDLGKLYRDLTGEELQDNDNKKFEGRFFDGGRLKVNGFWGDAPLNDIRHYLKTIDERLYILEDLKNGMSDLDYNVHGYTQVENQICSLRTILTDAYKFIEYAFYEIRNRSYYGRNGKTTEELKIDIKKMEGLRDDSDPVVYGQRGSKNLLK
jgi:hypothetical protein